MNIFNPTDLPINDYPIEDPKTKEVGLWSIGPGQTLAFPDYVGAYFLEVYGFLQEVITQEEKDRREKEIKMINENKHFTQLKIVKAEPAPQKKEAEGVSSETMRHQPKKDEMVGAPTEIA